MLGIRSHIVVVISCNRWTVLARPTLAAGWTTSQPPSSTSFNLSKKLKKKTTTDPRNENVLECRQRQQHLRLQQQLLRHQQVRAQLLLVRRSILRSGWSHTWWSIWSFYRAGCWRSAERFWNKETGQDQPELGKQIKNRGFFNFLHPAIRLVNLFESHTCWINS